MEPETVTGTVQAGFELGGRQLEPGNHLSFDLACRFVHLVIELPVDNLGPIMAADLAGKLRLNLSPSQRVALARAVGLEPPSLYVRPRPWRRRRPHLGLVR